MTKSISIFWVSLISIGIGLTLSASAAMSARQSVVPGQSIGRVSLGMPRTDVWKHLGRPEATGCFTLSGHLYRWEEWRNPNNSFEMGTVSRRGRVVQIECDVTDNERRHFLFPLLRGRHPHLKLNLYDELEDNGCTFAADDLPLGIAWSLYMNHYKDGAFGTQVLNEVGPDRIIVHWPGVKVTQSAGRTPDKDDPEFGNIRAWFAASPQAHKGN